MPQKPGIVEAGVGLPASAEVTVNLRLCGMAALGPGGLVDFRWWPGVAVLDEDPVFEAEAAVGLEGAIADEFGVEAAIVGMIDLFGHDAVEGRAYSSDGLGGVDGKRGRVLSNGCEGRQPKKQERETEDTHARQSLFGSLRTLTSPAFANPIGTVVRRQVGMATPGVVLRS